MAIGGYRFRRSFGNVASRFRGARFDTYPLTPYPTEGLVLDLAAFTYTDSGVQDKSGEDNEAVLYSGRGANLAGADYVELPDVGATKSITVLVRSSTDTTLYATDDAAQTEDASVALVADGTWQEVTLTFANAISGKIRLGSDGTSFFSGDLADARCKDANGVLLDQFYLNEHTDTAAAGLDGLPVIGRNGNTGQYVNCAAVVQEGFDSALAGLGAYGDYQWFNGVDTFASTSSVSYADTGDFDVEATVNLSSFSGNPVILQQGESASDRFACYVTTSGELAFFIDGTGGPVNALSGYTIQTHTTYKLKWVADRSANVSFFVDDVEVGTPVAISAAGSITSTTINIGKVAHATTNWVEGLIYNVSISNGSSQVTNEWKGYGPTPWRDTIGSNDGTPSGTFNTVAELRTTPPQVLGMDFNQYRWFNGVDTVVTTPTTGISELDLTSSDDFEIECSFIEAIGTPTSFRRIISLDSDTGGFDLFLGRASAGTELGVGFAVIGDANYYTTTAEVFSQGVAVHVKVVWNGGSPTIYVDGVSYPTTSTNNWSGSNNSSINIGAKNASGYTQGFNGVIYNARINNSSGTALWCQNGYGATPWKDTIGSNDGTESGTFENVLVPESLNKGIDALGNPIESPRTNKTFNADGSGYALSAIPEMTACSVILRGDFFKDYSAVDGVLLDSNGTSNLKVWKNDAQLESELTFIFAGRAYKITIPDSNATIALIYDGVGLSVNAYVDGSAQTPIGITGTLGASIDAADLYISTNIVASLPYSNQFEVTPIYNRALTADEVAKFS